MKKTLLFALLVTVSFPASANTYVRLTAGAAADLPAVRDFERRCSRPNPKTGSCSIWHSRVVSDTEAPTVEVAVGKDLGFVRLEANAGYVRVGANEAGCIDCKGGNTGSNGLGPYSPEEQEGATDIGTFTLNALGDVAVTDRLTLSAGSGVGAAYYSPHTSYPDNRGWRQMNASIEGMWRLIGEARYRVTDRLEAGLRWTRDDIGSRRVDFGDRNHTLSSVDKPVRYHTATAGITYRFGG
jgi:opacity protein-like surface antigen